MFLKHTKSLGMVHVSVEIIIYKIQSFLVLLLIYIMSFLSIFFVFFKFSYKDLYGTFTLSF